MRKVKIHVCACLQMVKAQAVDTSGHAVAICVSRERTKMSSYVLGCLLSLPLSLFHSSTWWWQGAQSRETPQERRGEESSLVHPFSDNSPSQSYHVLLTRQSNSGPLNFTLNWWRSSPCQSLRDFRRSSKAKEHNEWKAPSQIDFKLNQTLVFNYLPQLPELNRGTLKLYIRRERKKGVRKWGEGEGGPGAECKWFHPCVVSEQVALW